MTWACLNVVKEVRRMALGHLIDYRKTGDTFSLARYTGNREYIMGYIDAMWQIDDKGMSLKKFRRQVIKQAKKL